MKLILYCNVKYLCVVTTMIYSMCLNAGWTSSGGETLKDKINPWFFHNTKQVNYCVLVDTKNFGQSLSDIRRRISKGLEIWRHQLQNLSMNSIGGSLIKSHELVLATQNYNEVPCSIKEGKIHPSNIDLTFQFGVLTGEQLRRLGDPTEYIGITVRTDYDTENLKAKGFIYFSPEAGPLKLNKVGLVEKPWSTFNGRRLLDGILHELGHIYGIHHGSNLYLMDEGYLEELLSKNNEREEDYQAPYEKEEGDIFLLVNFFKFEVPENFQFDMYCRTSSVAEAPISKPTEPDPEHSLFSYLNITKYKINKEIEIKHKLNDLNSLSLSAEEKYFGYNDRNKFGEKKYCFNVIRNGFEYKFNLVKVEGDHRTLIGSSDSLQRIEIGYKGEKSIIKFWIPKEQKVFSLINQDIAKNYIERSHEIAFSQSGTLFKGTYGVVATGEKRLFFIQTHAYWQLSFGGVLEGKIYNDLEEGY